MPAPYNKIRPGKLELQLFYGEINYNTTHLLLNLPDTPTYLNLGQVIVREIPTIERVALKRQILQQNHADFFNCNDFFHNDFVLTVRCSILFS